MSMFISDIQTQNGYGLMNNSNEIQTIKTARFKKVKHTNRKRHFKRLTFNISKEIILEPKSVVILELK
jgi:hypothetical protein